MVILLTVISLAYMVFEVIRIALSFIKASRLKRCKLLKNYKKGEFIAIFGAAWPLYLAAYIKNGESVLNVIFDSFSAMLRTVAVSFDLDVLTPLARESLLFHIAIGFCAVLAVVNTFLLSASILFRKAFNNRMLRRIKRCRRDVCVLVGFNEKGRSILSSIDVKKQKMDLLVLSSELSDEDKEIIYAARGAYKSFDGDIASTLNNLCDGPGRGFTKRHCDIILLADNEEDNIRYGFSIAKMTERLGSELALASDRKIGVDAYLFSNDANEAIYERISRKSYGTVHCMNKYQMLSCDFAMQYPITEFIPHLIDKKHAALKEGADVRIIMVGFGKMNRQLFRIYTQNNQCMIMENGKAVEKPLKYVVFDKKRAYDESSFNHTYLHYRNWKKNLTDTDDYFELPSEPADVEFHEEDINSAEFPISLNNSLSKNENSFNMVVVSVGDTREALDIAEKIAVNAKEAKADKNTVLFVRVRNSALIRELKNDVFNDVPIIPFGDELSLYTYERIVNPAADSMAKDRHLCYSVESKDQTKTEEELRLNAISKWLFKWDTIQRNSNIYAVLSIRMRLQLLGYDYVLKSYPAKDASEDFLKDYTAGNPIVYKDETVNGKKLINYKAKYRKDGTPRSILAQTEHSRWNAYHICNGFVPASKTEYLNEEKGVLLQRRRHINLTTFKGLDDYDRWRTSPTSSPDERPDVIFYDYQLMDDAVWMLDRNGYKIIRKD